MLPAQVISVKFRETLLSVLGAKPNINWEEVMSPYVLNFFDVGTGKHTVELPPPPVDLD